MKKKLILLVILGLFIYCGLWTSNLYSNISYNKKCTVLIEASEKLFFRDLFIRNRYTIGSGVIIDSNGTILTAKHVVEDVDKVRITLYDGSVYDVNNIYFDDDSDIAIMKLDTYIPNFAKLGDVNDIENRNIIYGIGNAEGIWDNKVSIGYIYKNLFKRMFFGDNSYILVRMKTYEGCSGGGVFYHRELIGMVTHGWVGEDRVTFAISIDEIKNFLENLPSESVKIGD